MSGLGNSIGLAQDVTVLGGLPPLAIKSVPIFAYYEVKAAGDAASLADLGPNGYTLTQATGTKRPVFTATDAILNGQPSLTSDKVDDELVSATMPLTAPGTTPKWYWFIFAQITWSGGCLFGGGGGNNHIVFGNTSSPNLRAFNGALSNLNPGAPLNTAKRGILSLANATTDYLQLGSNKQSAIALGNTSTTGFAIFSGNGGPYGNYALNRLLITVGEPSKAERDALDIYASTIFTSSVLT